MSDVFTAAKVREIRKQWDAEKAKLCQKSDIWIVRGLDGFRSCGLPPGHDSDCAIVLTEEDQAILSQVISHTNESMVS